MNEYNFELIFRLDEGEPPESHIDAIYEAGCSDATVFMGKTGYMGIGFIRTKNTAINAMETAIRDIKSAVPHAQFVRAAPDLLNLSELAFLFDFTKQNMRKYARSEIVTVEDGFPSAVITGKSSYWHAAEIAQWLNEQNIRKIESSTIEVLFTIWSLNQANEILHQPNPEMTTAFSALLKNVA